MQFRLTPYVLEEPADGMGGLFVRGADNVPSQSFSAYRSKVGTFCRHAGLERVIAPEVLLVDQWWRHPESSTIPGPLDAQKDAHAFAHIRDVELASWNPPKSMFQMKTLPDDIYAHIQKIQSASSRPTGNKGAAVVVFSHGNTITGIMNMEEHRHCIGSGAVSIVAYKMSADYKRTAQRSMEYAGAMKKVGYKPSHGVPHLRPSYQAEKLGSAVIYTGEGVPSPKVFSLEYYVEMGILGPGDFDTCDESACIAWFQQNGLTPQSIGLSHYCDRGAGAYRGFIGYFSAGMESRCAPVLVDAWK